MSDEGATFVSLVGFAHLIGLRVLGDTPAVGSITSPLISMCRFEFSDDGNSELGV